MLRLIGGILAGAVAGFAVVFAAEALGHLIFPVPTGVDWNDPAAVKAAIAALPVGALAWLVAGWALAAFTAAAVALLIAQRRRIAGFIAAGVVLAATLANLMMLPHPLWVAVSGVVAIVLAALLTDRLLARKG